MMDRISYIPFSQIHPSLKEEMVAGFEQFYDQQQYILGPQLATFEKTYATYNGVKHAIGTGNGHDALLIILRSLQIGKGDEVILPAHTFMATALSIINADATPVLVDVDPDSFNIDPAQIEAHITKRTKAIIPVHLYGNPCAMDHILRIANTHKIHVIEDNAQAVGAMFNGKKTGAFGIMNFSSFYPTKNLGALGDGGIITTDSKELAKKAQSIRNYGRLNEGSYTERGINSRLDELQAVLLNVKMKYLDQWNTARSVIAEQYETLLCDIDEIKTQSVRADAKNVRHIFPILSDRRDELRSFLAMNGIETLIHYKKPIHLHPTFSFLKNKKGIYRNAENICAKELSLPIYPGLKEKEVIYICEKIQNFYAKS